MAPAYYDREVSQELSCIPLSNAQKEAILKGMKLHINFIYK